MEQRRKLLNTLKAGAIAALLAAPALDAPVAARAFGNDEMASPASKVSEANQAFRAIGRVECRLPDGEVRTSNAFLVGAERLMAASGELFGARAETLKGCAAHFYDSNGMAEDAVAVTRLAAPAHKISAIALFRLARANTYARRALNPARGEHAPRLDGATVEMVTLAAQRGGALRKVKSGGRALRLSPATARARGVSVSKVMAVSYDSVSASRGSPVFDGAGRLVGVHSGSYCPSGSAFDRDSCFNELSLIDEQDYTWIAAQAKLLTVSRNLPKP